MENTSFKVEDVVVDVINKGNFSQEQRTKLKNFFSQNIVITIIIINFNLFEPRKKTNIIILPSAPPYYE